MSNRVNTRKRVLIVVGIVVLACLLLGIGAATIGGAVYALTQTIDWRGPWTDVVSMAMPARAAADGDERGVVIAAVIEDGALIGTGCTIGPFCHVGPQVVLDAGAVLKSHVVVSGDTHIGEGTVVFPFAVLGEIPQDLKFDGDETQLRIGNRNRIR